MDSLKNTIYHRQIISLISVLNLYFTNNPTNFLWVTSL